MIKSELRGTGVAIVTPFDRQGLVDFVALEKLINYIIEGGIQYIVTLGTTGETPVLTTAEKKEIIQFTYEIVNDRVPVVVGAGGNNTAALIAEIKKMPLRKATAILSASPYYSKPTQEGIMQHYASIADAAPKPILLYNVPGRTGRNMEANTTLRLAKHKNIAGIKEATDNMFQCIDILRKAPKDFLVVSGDDGLCMAQIACGMDGVISVAANAYPTEMSNMVAASLAFDFKKAKKINDSLIDAYNLMFAENNPAGVKAFLAAKKIIKNQLRLPGVPVSATLLDKIKQVCKA